VKKKIVRFKILFQPFIDMAIFFLAK